MLLDIRKRLYGYDTYRCPTVDCVARRSEIDVLLSQRPSKGGLPPNMLMAYLDKTTPLDVKMQLEPLMSSSNSQHVCENEEEALASIIPRNLSVSQLEDLIVEQSQVLRNNSKSKDSKDG